MNILIYYRNHYSCDMCKIDWQMTADSACNDKCPECNKEYEPFQSDEHGEIVDYMKSGMANLMLDRLSSQLISQIIKFLDKNPEFEFEDQVKRLTADEIIDGIFEKDNAYHVVTTDIKSGEGLYYDLDDKEIVIQDLIWILAQLEDQVRV